MLIANQREDLKIVFRGKNCPNHPVADVKTCRFAHERVISFDIFK